MRLLQERRRWFGASTDNDAIKSARALSVEMAAQSRETQRVFHGLRGENDRLVRSVAELGAQSAARSGVPSKIVRVSINSATRTPRECCCSTGR